MIQDQRKRRVRALLRAAKSLADASTEPGKQVRASLLAQGPLSSQGVELALRNHLEFEAEAADLDALLLAAGDVGYAHVVLSANVFVGALRALALAAAAAPRVSVRMSRRESAFTAALLAQVDEPAFGEPIVVSEGLVQGWLDAVPVEVHLYGRDETLVRVASTLPEKLWVRAHGAGMGLVVVGKSAELDQVAEAIVADVVPFDQRGCLSPRVVLVEGGQDRAVALGRTIASFLKRAEMNVSMGRLEPEVLSEVTRYRQTVLMVGELFEAGRGSVGVGPGMVWIPPVGRNVHVVACEAREAVTLLGTVRRWVVAVGVAGGGEDRLIESVLEQVPGVRVSPVGWMQRPPLDGPVDWRTELLTPTQVVARFG